MTGPISPEYDYDRPTPSLLKPRISNETILHTDTVNGLSQKDLPFFITSRFSLSLIIKDKNDIHRTIHKTIYKITSSGNTIS
jgi:hypothetical protein